jgi:DNA-binding transcriptional MerR regulator
VRLKALYTSREVAALTGLTARQLQWWHARRVFVPTHAPQRTAAGGFTERRYTPVELLELMVLADLRRRGFTVGSLRRLLENLRSRFEVRLFEAIEGGGAIALFVDGPHIFARTQSGEFYNVLGNPRQSLLMVGEGTMRPLVVREPRRTARKRKRAISSDESERSTRGRRRGGG